MHRFARITLPLAALNFLNQASRVAVATIGPLLAIEFGLSAGGLGLLAAVFFAAYALNQLPIGLALDLYGVRRVQTVLALLAGLGCVLCALADDTLLFAIGRFVTGLGIAGGLIGLLKAHTQWYPRDRVAALTGAGVFVSSLGGLAATIPLQSLLPWIGWRGAFWLLAASAAGVATWIALSVRDPPHRPVPPAGRSFGTELAEFRRIAVHPMFLRCVPAVALLSALNFAYQGLWAGPWLRDVGLLDDAARAQVLFCYALGQMSGSLITGTLASLVQRRGGAPMLVPCLAMAGLAAVQAVLALSPPHETAALAALWFAFPFCGAAAPAAYAVIAQHFPPDLAGRVTTAINGSMLALVFVLQNGIGFVLDRWPRTAADGWAPEAYAWAMLITLGLQAVATLWLIAAPVAWRAPGMAR